MELTGKYTPFESTRITLLTPKIEIYAAPHENTKDQRELHLCQTIREESDDKKLTSFIVVSSCDVSAANDH